MRLSHFRCAAIALIFSACSGTSLPAAEKADRDSTSLLKDGDRIVFVGNGFVERARHYSWMELILTSAESEKQLTFRNLGAQEDTVFGAARVRDPDSADPDEGFRTLISQVRAAEPTVLIVGYGWDESAAGPDGLAEFEAGATRLLTELKEITPRILVVGPHITDRPRVAKATQQRVADIRSYSKAFERAARSLDLRFISLLWIHLDERTRMTTVNGWTLNEYGHRKVGEWIATVGLGSPDRGFRVHFRDSQLVSSRGGRVSDIEDSNGVLEFNVSRPTIFRPGDRLGLRVQGLESGLYGLTIGGVRVSRGAGTSNDYIAGGISYDVGATSPLTKTATALRKAIVEKNRLFFEAWRPDEDVDFNDVRAYHPYPADLAKVKELERRIVELNRPETVRFRLDRTSRPRIR